MESARPSANRLRDRRLRDRRLRDRRRDHAIRGAVLLLAGTLLAGVLPAAACTTRTKELPQGPPREIRIINGVELADDDRTLTVRYWGTACETFSDAQIDYGITQIKIAVHALVTTEDCRRSGRQLTTTITLDQPLENRIIIDANTNTVIGVASVWWTGCFAGL